MNVVVGGLVERDPRGDDLAWEPQFLAYFDTRATNGRTEGVNRIIKHVKRTGFGYRNLTNYRLKILYRCTRLPSDPEPAERPPAAGNA